MCTAKCLPIHGTGRVPCSYPFTMGAGQPVIVDQSMAASTKFLNGSNHYSGAVVGHVVVSITDLMAIVTAIIIAMIEVDVSVGKSRITGLL